MFNNMCKRFMSKIIKSNELGNYCVLKYKKDYINILPNNNEIIYLDSGLNKSNFICEYTKKEKICGDCECNNICDLKISDIQTIFKN